MKELITTHRSRLFVYLVISILSMTTLYGSFYVTSQTLEMQVLKRDVLKNRELIRDLIDRMHEREVIAAKYIPMLEGLKSVVDQHADLLKRIMDRQKVMNTFIEAPLKKTKKK